MGLRLRTSTTPNDDFAAVCCWCGDTTMVNLAYYRDGQPWTRYRCGFCSALAAIRASTPPCAQTKMIRALYELSSMMNDIRDHAEYAALVAAAEEARHNRSQPPPPRPPGRRPGSPRIIPGWPVSMPPASGPSQPSPYAGAASSSTQTNMPRPASAPHTQEDEAAQPNIQNACQATQPNQQFVPALSLRSDSSDRAEQSDLSMRFPPSPRSHVSSLADSRGSMLGSIDSSGS